MIDFPEERDILTKYFCREKKYNDEYDIEYVRKKISPLFLSL